jgi:hypothetical protein
MRHIKLFENFGQLRVSISKKTDENWQLIKNEFPTLPILETHRKGGIGKAIKLAVVEYCESIGAGIVTANIRVDNIASQKLSLSCGWQKSDKLTSNGFNTFYKVLNTN